MYELICLGVLHGYEAVEKHVASFNREINGAAACCRHAVSGAVALAATLGEIKRAKVTLPAPFDLRQLVLFRPGLVPHGAVFPEVSQYSSSVLYFPEVSRSTSSCTSRRDTGKLS
jgi:hypothetical protein